jgi:hypothetical protein
MLSAAETVTAWNCGMVGVLNIPVTDHAGPQGCETLRLPHFPDSRLTHGGEVVSLTRRPATLYPTGRFLVLISVRG